MSSSIIKTGYREYKNNRGYEYNELWELSSAGITTVTKTLDDGLGEKISEIIKYVKDGDKLIEETRDTSIDSLRTHEKIQIQSTKLDSAEWQEVVKKDLTTQSEYVEKTGTDIDGFWKEQWFQAADHLTKWARKEGKKGDDEWREEWYEKQSDLKEYEERKCEKWATNHLTNFEWNEKWGETKEEKWADKWFVDKTTGFRRGENWGHAYDGNGNPVHHWCEHWDSTGHMIKRDEFY